MNGGGERDQNHSDLKERKVVESIEECAEDGHVKKCLQEQEATEKSIDFSFCQEVWLDLSVGDGLLSSSYGIEFCSPPSHECVDETVGKCCCDEQRTGEV